MYWKGYLELRKRVRGRQRMDSEDVRRYKRSGLGAGLLFALAAFVLPPLGTQESLKTILTLSLIFGAVAFLTVQIAVRGILRSFKLLLMVRPLVPDEDSNSEGDDQGVGSGDD